jgi:hypothetical protein
VVLVEATEGEGVLTKGGEAVRRLLLVGILLAGIAAQVDAEGADTFEQLLRARSMKCLFHDGSLGDFQKGKLEVKKLREEMTIDFDAIDLKAGTARSLGENGASNETVLATPTGLTFIEKTGSGNVVVTTVFATKRTSQDFIAVMSRHMSMLGTVVPSQYYGTCRVRPSQ